MNDIFYLVDRKITTSDIEKLFDNMENITISSYPASGEMRFTVENANIDMVVMEPNEFGDELNTEFINDNKIQSIVCISHHKRDLKIVLEVFDIILNKFGGWLGNDDEGFLPVFSLENLSSFNYE